MFKRSNRFGLTILDEKQRCALNANEFQNIQVEKIQFTSKTAVFTFYIFTLVKKCHYHVQLRAKQTATLENKHYQNKVTLTGQSQPLKCCQLLEILTHFKTGLDLSMMKYGVCRSKGCKVAGHQTMKMVPPRYNSNPGQSVRQGPGP